MREYSVRSRVVRSLRTHGYSVGAARTRATSAPAGTADQRHCFRWTIGAGPSPGADVARGEPSRGGDVAATRQPCSARRSAHRTRRECTERVDGAAQESSSDWAASLGSLRLGSHGCNGMARRSASSGRIWTAFQRPSPTSASSPRHVRHPRLGPPPSTSALGLGPPLSTSTPRPACPRAYVAQWAHHPVLARCRLVPEGNQRPA